MKKITIFLILIGLALSGYYLYAANKKGNEQLIPSAEEAELTGFQFVQDFIKTAPPEPDREAITRAYNALSREAKNRIDDNNISGSLAGMFGIQDIPDMGVSVENLKLIENEAVLTVGLNYSGSGRALKDIKLIVEDGRWRVNDVKSSDAI